MKIATTHASVSEIVTSMLPVLEQRGWTLDRITPPGRGIHLKSRANNVRIGLLSKIDPVAVAAHLARLPPTVESQLCPPPPTFPTPGK